MKNATGQLQPLLSFLTSLARQLKLTDSEWARRAGLRKETLSRLRRRESCDFASLYALGEVVGGRVGVLDKRRPGTTADGLFPASLDRDYEEQLLELCAARDLNTDRWASSGPRYFVAGLAVMVAAVDGFDRPQLLALAEQLHPGAREPVTLVRWLKDSPVRLSRFMPMLVARQTSGAA